MTQLIRIHALRLDLGNSALVVPSHALHSDRYKVNLYYIQGYSVNTYGQGKTP